MTSIERTDSALLLQFDRDDVVDADVRRFALVTAVLPVPGFAVLDGDDEVVLRWDGRPTAAALLGASRSRLLRAVLP